MSETTYRCESHGHRYSADAAPASMRCPRDRSLLLREDGGPATLPVTTTAPASTPAARAPGLRTVRQLRIEFDDGTVVVEPGTQAMVGRDGEYSGHADLFAGNDHVSRRHALFGLDEDGRAWVWDWYSTNLTTVNGEPLPPGGRTTIHDEDLLRLSADVTGTVKLIREDFDA